MSTVRDRNVIDITLVEEDRFVLVILDDMEWSFAGRQPHAAALQNKLNDYLGYIGSGQAEEAKPGLRPVIRILAQYSYSRYCLDFLERVRNYIKNNGDICDIEWTHSENDGPFEDGFSDDFVFDPENVYPRLKKNWSDNPQEKVALMAVSEDAPEYSDLVMYRVLDSYVLLFVQDVGSAFTYIKYDMLPEGMTPDQLQAKAYENLSADIQYRSCESKEPGIFGILAGGDFEAESLSFPEMWLSLAEELDDDLAVCVPTKDLVFYTKNSDRKRKKKMLNMASETLRRNLKETPYLVFSKDVFIFSREKKSLTVSEKESIG